MSESELQMIVENNRGPECIAFFKGMIEAERRRLAPLCLQLLKQAKKGERDVVVAEAAVLATGTSTELKAISWRVARNQDLAFAIVSDRRPEWAAAWVDKLLQETYYWFHWALVRRLIRAGVISKPESPNYILAMISGLAGHRFNREQSIEELLRADPELLDDEVWRLFHYDGVGENSLANWDGSRDSGTWHAALLRFAAEGRLSRERLLASSLDALERDFNHYRAKWFATFHDGLAPTAEELRECAPRYLRLVGASATNIATWALDLVSKLAPQGVYDTSALVAGLQPALTSRQKATATRALALLASSASTPAAQREVLTCVAIALGHEATDVQKAALDLIDKYAAAVDSELAAAIADHVPLIAASLRGRLIRWTTGGVEPTTKKTAAKSTTSVGREPNLPELAPEIQRLWCIDALLENIKAGHAEIPAAIFDGTEILRLKDSQQLAPIADLDELIDACARVVEDEELVDEAERAFDGLSRLCNQTPDDFARRVGPLAKRATQRLKKHVFPFLGIGPADDLCGLVLAWTAGEVIQWKRGADRCVVAEFAGETHRWYGENLKKGLGFLSQRSMTLAKRVAAGQSTVLLSAPTHAGGWIDPVLLVQRVNGWSTGEPDVTDVCLALLRLAPDGRSQALATLKESRTDWILAVRYALGAPRMAIGETAALWIAAARARASWDDDLRVEKAFPNQGPDAGRAAEMSAIFKKDRTWITLKVHSEPVVPKSVNPACATVVLHQQRSEGNGLAWELGGPCGRTVGAVRWSATIWPLARESLFAGALETLADNLDWPEAAWQNKTLLEPLLDSGTPLRYCGLLLLATALAAKEPGESGLATDVAIRAIEDGRLGSDNLGRALAFLLPSGLIKPPRWQKTLAETARASPLHAMVIHNALQAALCGQPDKLPRDFGKLLELLLELASELNHSIANTSCRDFLQRCTTGKVAQTAKALLQLPPSNFADSASSILTQAIQCRVRYATHPNDLAARDGGE